MKKPVDIADDLLALADEQVGPVVDWGQLADLIADAEEAATYGERLSLLERARVVAGDNPFALALVPAR